MRVLQVSDSYLPFPGGVAEHIYNLKKYLERLGHEVWVLTAVYPGLSEEVDTNVIRRGRVILTPPLKIFNNTQLTITFDPRIFSFLRDFFRRERFDVVHLHGPLAPNLPGFALHYTPYPAVATFHTAFVGFNWNKLGKFLFNGDAKKLRKFIFVSETARKAVIPPYRGDWVIIPNGVDLELFYPAKRNKFVDGKINIGFLSRHEPRKGLQILLQAFAEDDELRKSSVLIIGSTGPLTPIYKRFCEEHGIEALFLGRIPKEELPDFYRKLDLFVAPALGGESFGLILLEAMACGTPVVASDIEGYRNVVKDRVNGLLFKNGDPMDLRDRLKELLRNVGLSTTIKENGLNFVKDFSWMEVVRKVEKVYKEVVEKC